MMFYPVDSGLQHIPRNHPVEVGGAFTALCETTYTAPPMPQRRYEPGGQMCHNCIAVSLRLKGIKP